MNKFILTVLLYNMLLTTICAQTKNDTIMIEKYDYEATENGTKSVSLHKGEWIIDIYCMPSGYQNEFAPACDFYQIQKQYHPNGTIKFKCKFLGNVPFGKREYYDESGKLIESIDEDAKFGKIKPEDLVEIMEKVGWINRKTGEAITAEKPLPTNGTFYRTIFYLSYSRNFRVPDLKKIFCC
jgi:antitoxin component YwqK of YwqJK toxin-antitoxin module